MAVNDIHTIEVDCRRGSHEVEFHREDDVRVYFPSDASTRRLSNALDWAAGSKDTNIYPGGMAVTFYDFR